METPDPRTAREQLGRLVGTWRGKETMLPSQWAPEGHVADGETISREGLGGLIVITDYRQTTDGLVTYEAHGVYLWDAKTSEVVLHWFDNMDGSRSESRGGWDGDVLTLSNDGPMGHMRKTTEFSPDGTLQSKLEMGANADSLALLFEGNYTKQS